MAAASTRFSTPARPKAWAPSSFPPFSLSYTRRSVRSWAPGKYPVLRCVCPGQAAFNRVESINILDNKTVLAGGGASPIYYLRTHTARPAPLTRVVLLHDLGHAHVEARVPRRLLRQTRRGDRRAEDLADAGMTKLRWWRRRYNEMASDRCVCMACSVSYDGKGVDGRCMYARTHASSLASSPARQRSGGRAPWRWSPRCAPGGWRGRPDPCGPTRSRKGESKVKKSAASGDGWAGRSTHTHTRRTHLPP